VSGTHGALDLSSLTARQVRDAISAREITAREAAEAALARIDAVEADVHAFNQLTPELAFEAAERIDRAVQAGEPLPHWPAYLWRSKTT